MFSFILMVLSESCMVMELGLFASSPHQLNPNTVFLCVSQGIQSAMSPLNNASFSDTRSFALPFSENHVCVTDEFSFLASSFQFPCIYNHLQGIV